MRRPLIGLTGLLLVTLGLTTPSVAAASTATPKAAAGTTCPFVHIYGVRGSGETAGGPYNGFGKTVQDIYSRFNTYGATTYPGQYRIDATAIDYPAVKVGYNSIAYGSAYHNSVSAGISILETALIRFYRTPCATQTGIVLIGYSQGAQVIGDALVTLPTNLLTNVSGVVLVADPRFNGADPRISYPFDGLGDGTNWGTYSPHNNGIARLVSPWKNARKLPRNLLSLCQANDPVCNFTPSNAALCVTSLTCPHLHYTDWKYNFLPWTEYAAEWLEISVFGTPCGPVQPRVIHPDGC